MQGKTPPMQEILDIKKFIEQGSDLYSAPSGLQGKMELVLSADVADYVTLLTISRDQNKVWFMICTI
jgi:hypothetical protein